jgi:hypothetical protein
MVPHFIDFFDLSGNEDDFGSVGHHRGGGGKGEDGEGDQCGWASEHKGAVGEWEA